MKRMVLLVWGVFVLPVWAQAAGYADKPIDVIVAYAPGGGTDVGARVLAKMAKKYIPQPLVVVNKPGAGGEIGFTALVQATPDGYAMGFINPPPTVMLPLYNLSMFGCLHVWLDSPADLNYC